MSSTLIKLEVEGGNAVPNPAISTRLGSKGVNLRDFCTQFNALTKNQKGKKLRVFVVVQPDKQFKIIVKGPSLIARIKEEAGIEKGSATPNRDKVGSIAYSVVEKIAEEMKESLTGFSQAANCKIIEGTARSIGVTIVK